MEPTRSHHSSSSASAGVSTPFKFEELDLKKKQNSVIKVIKVWKKTAEARATSESNPEAKITFNAVAGICENILDVMKEKKPWKKRELFVVRGGTPNDPKKIQTLIIAERETYKPKKIQKLDTPTLEVRRKPRLKELTFLVTNPDNVRSLQTQRVTVGGAASYGCASFGLMALKEGKEVYLDSLRSAMGFYEKLGFRPIKPDSHSSAPSGYTAGGNCLVLPKDTVRELQKEFAL